MIPYLCTITSLLFIQFSIGQTTLQGVIQDKKGNPIVGANIYLEGTYDGASSDTDGNFRFTTTEKGTQTLVVSMIAYETFYQTGDISYFKEIKITLYEAINSLTGVTLTAGTFEAGDNSKASVLKPLDIVTTAGAAGDFVAALQTLPGTSTVSEDGRLFVRGGEAGETQVFIDGLRVFQPFNATANNIPTRGRFSPFLFKGISFSTGGYSAEYGQALSSVLLLNTTDVPDQEKTDISIMSVGGGVGHTSLWGDESLSINTSYINLAPYESLLPSDQGVRWIDPFESISGEAVFRSKKDKRIFKLYTGFTHSNLHIEQEDINFDDFVSFRLQNNNIYLNSSYKYFFDTNWVIQAGASISNDTNAIGVAENSIATRETASHIKLKAHKSFSSRFKLNTGAEYFISDYSENFFDANNFSFEGGVQDNLGAAYAETDIFFTNKFAIKLGIRGEYTSVLDEFSISPRTSLAYKSDVLGQFSLAYGDFYQKPNTNILRFSNGLASQKTSHYILNYQYIKDGRTFRAEAYYKDYSNLVRYDTDIPELNSNFTNLGEGFARGIDIFWRDNKNIKNLDYWVSYSYLDTERQFQNFAEKATPSFAATHNLSVVTKLWINKLRSQMGLSYSFASGRPFDNPNIAGFLSDKTPSFNNLSFNWAYLISQQKILYFSVNNVLGFNNVTGYQYANSPNANGIFNRRAIQPPADSFFFVGFFWTLSSDKKSNQLDNL